MAATAAKPRSPFDQLLDIVKLIGLEGWEFTLASEASTLRLDVEMFDGVLSLKSDGTWNYS